MQDAVSASLDGLLFGFFIAVVSAAILHRGRSSALGLRAVSLRLCLLGAFVWLCADSLRQEDAAPLIATLAAAACGLYVLRGWWTPARAGAPVAGRVTRLRLRAGRRPAVVARPQSPAAPAGLRHRALMVVLDDRGVPEPAQPRAGAATDHRIRGPARRRA